MNGRIIPLALDAYDTDGLQGIYCPETSAAKNRQKASNEAISTAGTTFGDLASTVIRTGAGYAFYIHFAGGASALCLQAQVRQPGLPDIVAKIVDGSKDFVAVKARSSASTSTSATTPETLS